MWRRGSAANPEELGVLRLDTYPRQGSVHSDSPLPSSKRQATLVYIGLSLFTVFLTQSPVLKKNMKSPWTAVAVPSDHVPEVGKGQGQEEITG